MLRRTRINLKMRRARMEISMPTYCLHLIKPTSMRLSTICLITIQAITLSPLNPMKTIPFNMTLFLSARAEEAQALMCLLSQLSQAIPNSTAETDTTKVEAGERKAQMRKKNGKKETRDWAPSHLLRI